MRIIPAFTTMDDVVAGFAGWEEDFRAAGDRRSIFLTLYGVVSAAIRRRLAERFFSDNEWTLRYAVAFANLYRDALIAYEGGHSASVPKAWRVAFDAARSGRGLVLQDLLLGVNAHVNNDLPRALSSAAIDPDRERRYKDHSAVNAVLGSVVEAATSRLAALYAPGLMSLDDCAGQLDEMLSLFSLEIARESAWESAVSLTNARNTVERNLTGGLIASRAAVMARLLLTPSLNPLFVEACRRLERDPGWLKLVAAALRSHDGHHDGLATNDPKNSSW